MPFLERNHGREDFLLVLYREHVGLEYALDGSGDFVGSQAIGTVKNPNGFDHDDNAKKTGALFGQSALYHLRCFCRLSWIILREVPDQDVGVKPYHRREVCRTVSAAPFATASFICFT